MLLKKIKLFLVKKSKHKINIEVKSDIKLPANNMIIEFVGVSGIGKSTLYRSVIDKLLGQWKFDFLNLNSTENLNDDKISGIHLELLINKVSNVNNFSFANFTKLQLVAYFDKILFDNVKIIDANHRHGFFLDEGLCHNFSQELQKLDDDKLKLILKNRFLIYLKTDDPSIIIRQIHKRSKEGGHTVYHHIGLNDTELLKLIENDIKQFDSFISRIEKIKTPFLLLNVEDGLEINTRKIIQFENEILNDQCN